MLARVTVISGLRVPTLTPPKSMLVDESVKSVLGVGKNTIESPPIPAERATPEIGVPVGRG